MIFESGDGYAETVFLFLSRVHYRVYDMTREELVALIGCFFFFSLTDLERLLYNPWLQNKRPPNFLSSATSLKLSVPSCLVISSCFYQSEVFSLWHHLFVDFDLINETSLNLYCRILVIIFFIFKQWSWIFLFYLISYAQVKLFLFLVSYILSKNFLTLTFNFFLFSWVMGCTRTLSLVSLIIRIIGISISLIATLTPLT